MSEFDCELIQSDKDGWSRSFEDQRKYWDDRYRQEREAFWKTMEEIRKS